MRVTPQLSNDRLIPADAAGQIGEPIQLDLAPGITLERLADDYLMFADGRGAWVAALSLAIHLGWCRREQDER